MIQVQPAACMKSLNNRYLKKEPVKQASDISVVPAGKTLSFMSIPSIAFQGKLVIPELPEDIHLAAKPDIHLTPKINFSDNLPKTKVKYLVYPQDPLVTKPELNSLPNNVQPGPVSNRVKIVDEESKPAVPDSSGNFVADINSPQFDRINTFHFVQKTLNMYEEALGRKIPWFFDNDQIKVRPLDGRSMNAFYERWEETIKLNYFNGRINPEETFYTSKMADIIAHETGHAILDGLQPTYLAWGSKGNILHEGFGDITASLLAMTNNTILEEVIEKTGGDFKKENLIASLAEQFGKSYYGNQLFLRNAINELKLSSFGRRKESKEIHSFSRLITGSLYEMIVKIAGEYSKEMETKAALQKTQKDFSKLLVRALGDFCTPGSASFEDFSKALLTSDKVDFNGKFHNLLLKVLLKRELLKPEDVKEWESEQQNFANIQFPVNNLTSSEDVTKFLNTYKKELGLPENVKYRISQAYTNKFGETFIQMQIPEIITVPYTDFEDSSKITNYKIELTEGITLAFDSDGKLFYNNHNRLTKNEIVDAIKDTQITLQNLQQNFDSTTGQPFPVYKDSGILVKVPRIKD